MALPVAVRARLVEMARFCPICGKPESKGEFSGELCVDCALSRLPQLENVHVAICQKCGRVVDRGNKPKEIGIEGEATRILKLKGAAPLYSDGFASVEYDTRYGRISRPLTLLLEKRLCTECSRSNSQYFEAIVQLRGDGGKVARMAERILLRLREKSFVPKIEELKEGIDLYCGSRNEAIAALNSHKLGFMRTEKLAGEKNGKRLYRTTLLVRL